MKEKEAINLSAKTLTGDVRDFLVDRLRHFPKPWGQMTESEQTAQIEAAVSAAKSLVKKAVKIIASEGRQTVPAKLEKITLKDGCKIELSAANGWISELAGALNNDVLIVTNWADEYTGERAPCKADPDEPELFNQEYREADGEDVPDPDVLSLPSPDIEAEDAEYEEVAANDDSDGPVLGDVDEDG